MSFTISLNKTVIFYSFESMLEKYHLITTQDWKNITGMQMIMQCLLSPFKR